MAIQKNEYHETSPYFNTEEEINFIENKGPDGSIDNDFAPPPVTDSVE